MNVPRVLVVQWGVGQLEFQNLVICARDNARDMMMIMRVLSRRID
jgi:hypothetical protein